MLEVARFQVGEAFLQVKPSLRRLHKDIGEAVNKWRDLDISVGANMDRFHTELAREASRIDVIEIDVTPNMSGFRERVAAGTSGVRSIEIGVVANTARARAEVGAFATEVKQRLEAATRALGDMRIDGDASPAERKISMLRARLATLQNQKIGLDINEGEALREIATVEVALAALARQSASIRVKVDSAAALAQMAALRSGFDNTDRSVGNFHGTLTRVGVGFVPIVKGVSSLLGGLGSLVGESSRVGSSLISTGATAAKFGGNLTELAGAGSGAASSILSVGTSLLSMAVIGAGLAAVGAVAVAALGQLGGAAIALASGIVPLVGLLGVLPGLLLPIGLAAGALAIAFGDEGLKKEIDELKKSFTPLVNDIRSQLRPALTEMLNSVETLVPVFQRAAPVITSAISEVTSGFSQMFRSSSFQSDLESILRASGQQIRDFGSAAQSGMRAFIDIMIEAQPAVNALTNYIRQGAADFQRFVAEGRRTGELREFFQQAVDVLINLLGVIRNAGGLFVDLWESANRTGAFMATLGAINDGISRFRDYVSQAGGAWDQLMARAGPVTESLVNLIGSIGRAFVEMGAQIDIVPLIDKIGSAITRLTPVFASIGQAAGPALTRVVELVTQLIEAVGPKASANLSSFGAQLERWGPNLVALATGLADAVTAFSIFFEILGTVVKTATGLFTAFGQAITGNFSGAAQTLRDMDTATNASIERVRELAGTIDTVPTDHTTTFTGDAASVTASITAATAGINSVPKSGLTTFLGDIQNLRQGVSEAISGVNSVPKTGLTSFLSDILNLRQGVADSISGIASVPGSHGSTFSGNPGPLLSAALQATNGISAIPGSKSTSITAVDNASRVAALVRAAYSLIPSAVTTTITAIQRTVAGQAGGGILAPMAAGGVLPMAQGDNLTPMQGGRAQLVPPNTWRVIGDRMRDMEAYIPINKSAASRSILAQTAELMGQAVIPRQLLPLLRMLAPVLGLAGGRVLRTDDSGRAVDWADEPAVPASTGYRSGRRRGRDSFSMISQLIQSLLIPRLRDQSSLGGRSVVEMWQRQAVTMAAAVRQLQESRQPRPERLGGPNRGTATPAGFDSAGGVYSSPRGGQPPPISRGTATPASSRDPAVINVYPQPQQSEESIASMVARRQAFVLRS